MLIKLRACTAQSLVVIIFAEFYDDFFLVGWFSTDELSIRLLPERRKHGRGCRGCLLAPCAVSCPARTLAPRPTACAFSSGRPGSCAEEQPRPRGVGAAEHESIFRARLWKTWVFVLLTRHVVTSYKHFQPKVCAFYSFSPTVVHWVFTDLTLFPSSYSS